ncbi:hypothetical protein R1sor_013141 [Riccia sorocarpa]|uniref:Uncharacterized protein n=1 Tax=Riccia sorocarpa TaxID=122646 RepID=A0ABD3H8L0_9MARC
MRLVAKIMNIEDLDWVHILRAIVEWKVLDTKSREREIGCPLEKLLVLGSRTAAIVKYLRKLGVQKLEDLNEHRMNEAEELAKCKGGRRYVRSTEGPTSYESWLIRTEIMTRGTARISVADPSLWTWKKVGVNAEGWSQPTAIWRQILEKTQDDEEKLNRMWQVDWNKERWRKWWMDFWKSEIFLGDFPPWRALLFCSYYENLNLISSLEWAVRTKALRIPFLLLWVTMTKWFWKERCLFHFEGKTSQLPVRTLINEALNIGRELEATAASKNRKQSAELAVAYLSLMKEKEDTECSKESYNRRRVEGIPPTASSECQSLDSLGPSTTSYVTTRTHNEQDEDEWTTSPSAERRREQHNAGLAEALTQLGFTDVS